MTSSSRSEVTPILFLCVCLGFSAARPARAEVRFLPGDTAHGPAIGTQLTPAIAAGGEGYLTAWQEFRSSPFSGPPSSALGRGIDIYAQRMDSDGARLSTPIPIAIGFGDQVAPQVAWNGENWLVAWETPCECWSYSSQIQAVRVSPAGTVLDPKPIVVHTNASEWFRMTSNGGEWLVALDSLRGVRISADGALVNPGGTQMAERSTTGRHAIVSAQGEYLLAWDSWGPAQGQRFTADLIPVGEPFSIPSTYIASSGEDYFVIWDDQSTYWDDWVYGRRYSLDGTPGPTLTLAGTGDALPLTYPGQMSVGWGGGRWWATWIETARGTVFTRVEPDGSVLDFGGMAVDPTAVAPHPMAKPAVTGRSTGGAQFVWQDRRADGGFFDILSAPVDSAGSPGEVVPVSTSARSQLFVDFAAGNNEVMSVFRSDLSGDLSVVAQRMDAAGNAIDLEPIVIARGVDYEATPRVGFDGTRYMVVWETDGQVYARRIQTSGVIVDPVPLVIMGGRFSDVAGLDGTFAVVTTQQTTGEHIWQPFSMRVDGVTGALLDATPVIIGGSFAVFPRIVAFGGRWLATWQENFTHDNPAAENKASFIEIDGSTAGAFVYSYGGVPDVAAAGDTAMFVWRTDTPGYDNNIVGRLITADGTLAPETLDIWTDPQDATNPEVGWNGSEFVVAWEDERNSLNYFDERKQIYAARVLVDGTVIDTDSLAFGDRAEMERDPAVVSIDGRTLIAASSFRNDAEHGIYRIVYEVYGDPATGNGPPVAVSSATPRQGDAPLPVSFSAAGSHDKDGSVVFHEWDFGDGTTSTIPDPGHTYSTQGNYLAQLVVSDNGGASTVNVERVVVESVNEEPVSRPISNLISGDPPLSVVFYARDSYDPDTGIQNWEWDFGDGWDYWGSTAYHTFNTPGVWTVTLKLHDFRGAIGTGTMTISVGQPNESPVADVSCSPLGGPAPLLVGFDGGGSSDPDGSIVSYAWNFGDGTTATGPTPSHVYASAGSYTASLTVRDEDGAQATDQVIVNVVPSSPQLKRVGAVPDRESPGKEPLRLSKSVTGAVSLTWSESCVATDSDYSVYAGPLGGFVQHEPVLCSTGGLSSATIVPAAGSSYYLVVPRDDTHEGSYGFDSSGGPRVAGTVQCLPTAAMLACP
jgi:PKD repeat protein